MPNDILKIANDVRDFVNVQAYSLSFTALRSYRPVEKLADLKTLHCTIVPRSERRELATRSTDQLTYEIDIALQQKVDNDSIAFIDPLMDLVAEVIDSLRGVAMAGFSWTSTQNDPIFSSDHIDQRVFTSIITLTYQGAK